MIKNYVKKPIKIRAVQWTGDNTNEIIAFAGNKYIIRESTIVKKLMFIGIVTTANADIGDYIIEGVDGEYYTCKPDVFEKIHEEIK